MSNFEKFSKLVDQQFQLMSSGELFKVTTTNNLWDVYLSSFPEGSNPESN